MPVSRDIAQMYRRPRAVVRDLYAMGPREDRAIAWLMIGCFLVFLSRLPALQRAAVETGTDFQQDTIYAFFALIYGLLVGFNGLNHPGTTLVGTIWLAVLFWFWISGLFETSKVN